MTLVLVKLGSVALALGALGAVCVVLAAVQWAADEHLGEPAARPLEREADHPQRTTWPHEEITS